MALTPISEKTNIIDIELEGSSNTLKVTTATPTLFLAESTPSTMPLEDDLAGQLEFEINDDGHYTIKGKGTMVTQAIKIPGHVGGIPVTEIAAEAFKGTDITGVTIPNTIKVIGDKAFEGTGLTYVNFENRDEIVIFFENTPGWSNPHVYYVYGEGEDQKSNVWPGKEMKIFDKEQNIYCYAIPLNTINISFNDGALTEGTNTLDVQNELELFPNALIIPTRVSPTEFDCSIERFYDTDIDINRNEKIPGGLRIGASAFQNCTSLTDTITISRQTTWIDSNAFTGCVNLETLRYAKYSWLNKIGPGAFKNCTSISGVVIPRTVAYLRTCAFAGCTSLQSFLYFDSLTKIGIEAFDGCTSLFQVVCIKEDATSTVPVNIKPRLKSIGSHAFRNCVGLITDHGDPDTTTNWIHIPSSVTYIGEGAFEGCEGFAESGYQIAIRLRFDDPYTWFSKESTLTGDTYSKMWKPALMASESIGFYVTTPAYGSWHKLKQMPPPELSLDGNILTMTDKLGLAEIFRIYVNNNTKAAVTIDRRQL